MSEYTPLEGITSEMVQTERLKMHVLSCGAEDGTPVIFLHGNFSSALYWEETMLALPGPSAGSGQGYRAVAPDLRGYGWTEDKLIDATRGMGDLSDDVAALFGTLGIEQAHLVGWSLGGGVIYRFLIDYPEKVRSVTLVSPVSPCGFGGTKDIEGTPCYDDFAGSGGGTVNPEFVKRIIDGGKLCQLFVSAEGARTIVRNLGGKGFLLTVQDQMTAEEAHSFLDLIAKEDASCN